MPKWHTRIYMASESVSFPGLFQNGTVRLALTAPDRERVSLKGTGTLQDGDEETGNPLIIE